MELLNLRKTYLGRMIDDKVVPRNHDCNYELLGHTWCQEDKDIWQKKIGIINIDFWLNWHIDTGVCSLVKIKSVTHAANMLNVYEIPTNQLPKDLSALMDQIGIFFYLDSGLFETNLPLQFPYFLQITCTLLMEVCIDKKLYMRLGQTRTQDQDT